MTNARVLFEDLEDRILLNGLSGLPMEVLLKLPRVSEKHVVTVQNQAARPGPPAPEVWTPFTLPKFDTRGGTRILVQVRLDFEAFINDGLAEFDNLDATGGTVDMDYGANVRVDCLMENSFDKAKSLSAQSHTVVQADEGNDEPDFNSLEGDYAFARPAGLREVDPPVVHSLPHDDLTPFCRQPGDTTIPFQYTSGAIWEVTTVDCNGDTRFNPWVRFGFTATVTYWYPVIGGDLPEEYWGGRHYVEYPEAKALQPLYSGTAEPGSTLWIGIYDVRGDLIGWQDVVVDAGGNWMANFSNTYVQEEPHTLVLRQRYAGYTPLADAGYNLRTDFAPAVLGGTFVSEHLTVENVTGKRAAAGAVAALYQAALHPIAMGWHAYPFEFLAAPATPSGI